MQEEVVSLEEWRRRYDRRAGQGIAWENPERDKLMEFVSDWVTMEKGLELIRLIGEYNNFIPSELEGFFEDSDGVGYIAVGFASSPVLYLRMKDGAPEGFVHEEFAALRESADDVEYQDELPLKIIRAWWD